MSTARRRISIHDYPEHLNPFSENHLTFQDKRKMLADKLRVRKNGTWSSKISKRLSRSVSWLEKSWLTAEESQKKPNSSSRICEVNDTAYQSRKQTNNLSRPVSYLDIRHLEDKTSNRAQIKPESDNRQIPSTPTTLTTPTTPTCSKPEPKRRKKRPAPLPPIADTKSDSLEKHESIPENVESEGEEKTQLHITSTDSTTGDQNTNINPAYCSSAEEITKTCQSKSIAEPQIDHTFNDDGGRDGGRHCKPSTSEQCNSATPTIVAHESHIHRLENKKLTNEINHQPISEHEQPTEQQPMAAIVVDHNQNEINSPQSEPQEDAPSTQSPLSTPSLAEQSQILDENANVPRDLSGPKSPESLSMHCNGKAVMV